MDRGTEQIWSTDIFPFLELPAELREQVYLYAIRPVPPIDTAAIPGTPEKVSYRKLLKYRDR